MVEFVVNGERIAIVEPGDQPKTAHLFFNLPNGSNALSFIVDDRIIPPQGRAWDLAVGNVVEMRVSGASKDAMATGLSGPAIKGAGQYQTTQLRFEVAVNGKRVATVGNPGAGGLSVDLIVWRRDGTVQVALHSTGSDEAGYRHWAFPFLQPGDYATIRPVVAGAADEPGLVEPPKAR
jgi:hypothetical protein